MILRIIFIVKNVSQIPNKIERIANVSLIGKKKFNLAQNSGAHCNEKLRPQAFKADWISDVMPSTAQVKKSLKNDQTQEPNEAKKSLSNCPI